MKISKLVMARPPYFEKIAQICEEYGFFQIINHGGLEEVSALVDRLLRLISQALGLEKDCLQKRLGETPARTAQANFYPPCPDPELTLGLAVHTDLRALTVLRQSTEVTGLQVIKDGKWVAVDPVPNAFSSIWVISYR
ncbi:1-aminocyclopropane-1-carboxylate oxidase 5 [Morella rubra]|uniref:1-aminocyclopropane-1-carboxylate oxidase 5 n=1 Tax=Morella rubra TaxID=262757 RepID=A0A6A1V598_9ROSI|nr:1-aminocyclopropane-1-carboxylate oxidase 5 [Morella rubra]